MGKIKIRDIVKRGADFKRFRIVDCKTYFALISEEKAFLRTYFETIRIEITTKRLEQLANDILNYLNKKAKWEAWKPTMEEFAVRLDQIRPKWGIESWFLNWIRSPKNKEEGRRIYEWLHSNREWLYRDE